MDPLTNQAGAKDGELTLKQGGIGFIIIAALMGGVAWAAGTGLLDNGVPQTWTVGGIPITVIAGVFGVCWRRPPARQGGAAALATR